MPSFKRRKVVVLLVVLLLVAIGIALFSHSANTHLRAMSVLLRFANPEAKGFSARFAQHPLQEQTGSAQNASGAFNYRIYKPTDVSNPGGIVLLHGVHRLGIDDPRLINFARVLAGAGIEVMTPELRDLADYRVTPQTVDQIGMAAVILSTEMKRAKVGVMGLSFAGGLALLTACKPVYANNIGFVVAIGSHDDLGRVSRFFALNSIEKPDGSTVPFQAHEYGVLVLAYSHLDGFFSAADEPAAKEALRLWLWEQSDAALKAAQQLSPPGQQEFDRLVHHRDQVQQQLLQEIQAHSGEMEAVSPHGHLANLNVPVFLLHGTGDSVIPASETLWLAQDVPHKDLKAVLVSPALIHVNMEDGVSLSQRWELVDFLAKVVDAADGLGH
jgi:pimeloyl-ACP methyl ester carboxylesterase